MRATLAGGFSRACEKDSSSSSDIDIGKEARAASAADEDDEEGERSIEGGDETGDEPICLCCNGERGAC